MLGNPQGKIKLLESDAKSEINLRTERTTIEKNLERLENDHGILVEQLESYKFLDSQWKEFSESRENTAESHRFFIANEGLANSLPVKEKEFELATKAVETTKKDLEKVSKELESASKDYDHGAHLMEKNALLDAERKTAETNANFENARKRADEIKNELERLAAVRKSMRQSFEEKEKLEKVGEATKFIRDTLKEAAPRVAQKLCFSRRDRSKSNVSRDQRKRRTDFEMER